MSLLTRVLPLSHTLDTAETVLVIESLYIAQRELLGCAVSLKAPNPLTPGVDRLLQFASQMADLCNRLQTEDSA